MASKNHLEMPFTSSELPTMLTGLPAPSPGMEPANKRRRLSPRAHGNLSTRKIQDSETALEVDYMILDYLLYQAINACLANLHCPWGDDKPSPVESSLVQVDQFYALFQHRYPTYKVDVQLLFRQQLLQLVALFTQRLARNSTTLSKASLQALREKNGRRARHWIGDASRVPSASLNTNAFDDGPNIKLQELERNRAVVLEDLDQPAEDDAYEDAFYGTSACTSLLDLLPLFMELSATCHHVYTDANEQWMLLAADLMVQACLEQYLVFGANGSDAVDEAFAWGFTKRTAGKRDRRDRNASKREEENESRVNAMFADESNTGEDEVWRKTRARALSTMCPFVEDTPIALHLSKIADARPIAHTERAILSFLRALFQGMSEPVLLQLEKGQLEGMSKEETRDFIRDCGLDGSAFFGAPAVV